MVLMVEVCKSMFLQSGVRTCINMRWVYPMLKIEEIKARRVLAGSTSGGERAEDVSRPEPR